MPAVQIVGDADSAGGVAQGGVASVRVNGQPVIVDGNSVTGHGKGPHSAPVTAGGNSTVKAGGVPIVTTGCTDSCGHVRAGGSSDVRIG